MNFKYAASGLLASTLVLASASALAVEPVARGFYAGAMAGATRFDDDGLFGNVSYDDRDWGYGAFGGYKILKYLAVEARLSDFGFDTTAYSGHVIGIIPFATSGWEIFGQLGIGSADLDGYETKTVGSAGFGARFYPTSHLGFSVQTDAYVFEEHNFNPSFVTTQLAVQYLF